MLDVFILILGILIPPIYVVWGIRDYKKLKRDRSFLVSSYIGTILANIVIVAILVLISDHANFQTDFSILGKGWEFYDKSMIQGITVGIIFISLLMPFFILRKKESETKFIGDIENLLPKSNRELIWFFFLVIAVAIGEEIIFREFYFEFLNERFGLTGDILLVATALIFSICHAYQGWSGLIATFFIGLVFGKIFQVTESLTIPILLHFIIDIKFLWIQIVKKFYNPHQLP